MRQMLPVIANKPGIKIYEVTSYLQQEIEDMRDMVEKGRFLRKKKGYALAHNQVSETPYRLFVARKGLFLFTDNDGVERAYDVFINAKITSKEDPYMVKEGCLSFPFRAYSKIKRYNKISVEFQDENLNILTGECMGTQAEVFQHEVEHINNITIYSKR